MSGKTITRADLIEVIREEVDLTWKECAALLENVLDEIADCLIEDDPVKIHAFGSFTVRQKAERMGCSRRRRRPDKDIGSAFAEFWNVVSSKLPPPWLTR